MQIISAALAFAITMLVLSMVVASLVETIHRLLGMRERGLYYLLGRFYDQVIGLYEPNQPPRWESRTEFQDRMSELRAPVGLTASTGSARISYSLIDWGDQPAASGATIVQRAENFLAALWRGVSASWRGRGLANLTSIEFMTRLGAHRLSDPIVQAANPGGGPPPAPLPPEVDIVLQDVAQKFELYSGEAAVSFERRARTLSIAVAVIVAFLLHVNAAEIFRTFLRDPAVAAAVIAKQDEVMKAFEAGRKERERQVPAVAANAAELPGLQQAAKDIEGLKREYEAMVARLKRAESELGGLGVPVGWTDERWIGLVGKPDRPLCESEGKPPREVVGKDTACAPGETRRIRGFGWGVFFGLLLGGLLVGLGGPFWYDTVSSLTSIRNIARGQTQAPGEPGARGAGGAIETPQPRTPVDAFKASYAGWIAARRLPAR
jgi:hypothetical protein